MSDPFAQAVADLFASALAVDADYTPAGGEAVGLRAIVAAPDVEAGILGARVASDSVVVEVPVSAVAAPAAGDTIEVLGETRVVQGSPRRDALRLVWTLDTRPQGD